MKSKAVFVLLGVFTAAALFLLYIGIQSEIIILIAGIVMIVLGMILMNKEISWRRNSDIVQGKVTRYFAYKNTAGIDTAGIAAMYTMEAEYITKSGKLMIAREQSGSTVKKYPEGAVLKIRYSRKDPDLFIVEGDNSRIYAIITVALMGVAIAALFGYLLINGIQIEQ